MRLRCFVILVLVLSLFLSGCVRRRMTVRSNPPGATVYLDGKEIGRTPFSTNFDFYGKREFRFVKDGYETKTVILPVRAPWYEWFPLDFASEVLLPGKLTDRKYYEADMQPLLVVPTPELIGRAEELKRYANVNGAFRVSESLNVNDPARQSGSLQSPATVYSPTAPEATPLAPPQPTPIYVPPRL